MEKVKNDVISLEEIAPISELWPINKIVIEGTEVFHVNENSPWKVDRCYRQYPAYRGEWDELIIILKREEST